MATEFAYVPSTSDGRTVRAPEPVAVPVAPDPVGDPSWAWLRSLATVEWDEQPDIPAAAAVPARA
jgi:hypothetical protein